MEREFLSLYDAMQALSKGCKITHIETPDIVYILWDRHRDVVSVQFRDVQSGELTETHDVSASQLISALSVLSDNGWELVENEVYRVN